MRDCNANECREFTYLESCCQEKLMSVVITQETRGMELESESQRRGLPACQSQHQGTTEEVLGERAERMTDSVMVLGVTDSVMV